jgi:nucleotide-binding universal stress UspA family protein
MFSKLLCPTDGSEHSAKALDLAIDLAKKYDASLVIMHVPHRSGNIDALQRFAEVEGLSQHVNTEIKRLQSMDPRLDLATGSAFQDSGISPRLLVEVGQHILDGAKGVAQQNGLENIDTRLQSGDPADSILRCIEEENIDCVVMGSRGLSDLKGVFLGSVSHKVANQAPCTCITVK